MSIADYRAHCIRTGQPNLLDTAAPAPPPKPVLSPDDIEPENAYTGKEKDLHTEFEKDMGRRGAWCERCRMDIASTLPNGSLDFRIAYTGADGQTRACWIEFKRAGGSISTKQREVLTEMRRLKIPVLVAWTLADAINFAKRSMNLP